MRWGEIPQKTASRILEAKKGERFVKDGDTLLAALVDELTHGLPAAIKEDGDVFFLLDGEGGNPTTHRVPRREHVWQAYVRRYLALRNGVVFFGREPQVGAREYLDLVAVPLGGATSPQEEVVIEIKLTDNADVLGSIQTQLATRYINPPHRRHGIYLVIYLDGETKCGARTLKPRVGAADIAGYRRYLDDEAARLSTSRITIRAVVIDGQQPLLTKPSATNTSATAPPATTVAALQNTAPTATNATAVAPVTPGPECFGDDAG
jgi:hypothetical protein